MSRFLDVEYLTIDGYGVDHRSTGGISMTRIVGARTTLIIGFIVAWLALPAVATAQLITAEDIKKISPRANDTLVQALVEGLPEFEKAGINTRLRMAHFLAQVMTETGGLRRLDENMNYSFKTLMRVFSRRTISESKAREVARKPVQVANWVYGARLGNRGRDTQDGWNYRGSGYIQLTGRDNFRRRGNELQLPLEENPEMARQAREGLLAAIAYWDANNINVAADNNDRERVRILVNGPAAHGLSQAKEWFNRAWIRVFRAKGDAGFEGSEMLAEDFTSEDLLGFDEILKSSNLLNDDFAVTESGANESREEAIRAFQAELGLPETGVLDEDTQLELLDPREWRHRDEDDVAIVVPDREASRSFDLAVDDVVTESGAAPVTELASNSGTGELSANVSLSRDVVDFLNEASAEYAPYEMGEKVNAPESFVPFSVIGEDTRTAVTNTTVFPASAVVQILFKNRFGRESLCTGTMISKDTVLTAGHCVHSGTRRGRPYEEFQIVPARNVGASPFGQCSAKRLYALSGWTDAATSLDARYYDLGAIKLDCDVGTRTGWLGVRLLSDEDLNLPTTVHGYAADIAPKGRQWVSDDMLRVLWELKGFYQNDTFGGTSGSPVYTESQNDTVIGVHTNGLHGDEPWKSNNAFTRITQDRLNRIIEWIEDDS